MRENERLGPVLVSAMFDSIPTGPMLSYSGQHYLLLPLLSICCYLCSHTRHLRQRPHCRQNTGAKMCLGIHCAQWSCLHKCCAVTKAVTIVTSFALVTLTSILSKFSMFSHTCCAGNLFACVPIVLTGPLPPVQSQRQMCQRKFSWHAATPAPTAMQADASEGVLLACIRILSQTPRVPVGRGGADTRLSHCKQRIFLYFCHAHHLHLIIGPYVMVGPMFVCHLCSMTIYVNLWVNVLLVIVVDVHTSLVDSM